MTLQHASMRLDPDGFNGMPPRQWILDGLSQCSYDVVDLAEDEEDGHWTNAYDTLVLRFALADVDSILWAASELKDADDIHYLIEGEHVVVRFWWD